MSVALENSPTIDNFESTLNSINAEADSLLAEAEQVLMDITGGTPNNSAPENNIEMATGNAEPDADAGDDNNSDVIEIVQEIPVVDLLDSTVDFGHEHNAINTLHREASGDDDIIFVQQIRNDNPVTIDLCSDSFIDQRQSTPNPETRRRRNRAQIGAIIIGTEEIPSRRFRLDEDLAAAVPVPDDPQNAPNVFSAVPVINDSQNASNLSISNSSVPLKCAICLDNASKKEPVSTVCGHIFCKLCIEQCINLTQKCPLCKKKLTRKGFHRLYLS